MSSKKGPRTKSARIEEKDAAFGIVDLRAAPPERVFRFQLGPAMLDQLRAKLETITPVALEPRISAPYAGFYQLILDGQPRYIGKTLKTVGSRLGMHFAKLSRLGAPLERMTCRFAFVEDLSLVDMTEQALIRYFGERGEAEWNGSGLGSNVSGYGRGGQKASQFSAMFKVDLQRPVQAGSDKPKRLRALISQIDKGAPIHFKIPTKFWKAFDASFDSDYRIPPDTRPFDIWVKWIQQEIGDEWRIVRQPMSWYIVPIKESV